MTCPSWVALHGIAHSFSELLKPLRHDKAAIHEGDYLTYLALKALLGLLLVSYDLKAHDNSNDNKANN